MNAARVLVVEDDKVALRLLAEVLERDGHKVETSESAEAALQTAREFRPHVVVTDVQLVRMDGLALLRELKNLAPSPQVIVMTAFGSLDTAVDAIRSGAFDYVSKPFRMDEMSRTVRRALDAYDTDRAPEPPPRLDRRELLGRSRAMTEVFTAVARVAPLKVSVLIEGETGTGKELVARAIHEKSARADGTYVTVNCVSLPEGLLESELFGHVKGAFTGAHSERKGLFAEAHGGTILLDEIGDMPLSVQAKLLRVLESGEVRAVGATQARHVDVRVLAATHRDLARAVEDGTFRRDLYYRLNAVTIRLPALRERREDLPLLMEHFLKRHAQAAGRSVTGFSSTARTLVERYGWPGNVRELSHVIERAVALAKGPQIEAEDLPQHLRSEHRAAATPSSQSLEEVERAHILAILRSVGGSRVRAAGILGIDRKTLYRKLLRYGLAEEHPET